MDELDILIEMIRERKVSTTKLSKMTGVSRPSIDGFFRKRDFKYSTYTGIRNAMRTLTKGQSLTPRELYALGLNIPEASNTELAELRIKVDLQDKLLATKDNVIELLKAQYRGKPYTDDSGTMKA